MEGRLLVKGVARREGAVGSGRRIPSPPSSSANTSSSDSVRDAAPEVAVVVAAVVVEAVVCTAVDEVVYNEEAMADEEDAVAVDVGGREDGWRSEGDPRGVSRVSPWVLCDDDGCCCCEVAGTPPPPPPSSRLEAVRDTAWEVVREELFFEGCLDTCVPCVNSTRVVVSFWGALLSLLMCVWDLASTVDLGGGWLLWDPLFMDTLDDDDAVEILDASSSSSDDDGGTILPMR